MLHDVAGQAKCLQCGSSLLAVELFRTRLQCLETCYQSVACFNESANAFSAFSNLLAPASATPIVMNCPTAGLWIAFNCFSEAYQGHFFSFCNARKKPICSKSNACESDRLMHGGIAAHAWRDSRSSDSSNKKPCQQQFWEFQGEDKFERST